MVIDDMEMMRGELVRLYPDYDDEIFRQARVENSYQVGEIKTWMDT